MKYGALSYLSVNGKVLMIQKIKRENDPNSGYYTLPGGKLKPYERKSTQGRLEGAIRETKEETGLRLINPVFRGIILFHNRERTFDNWKNPQDYLVYIFEAKKYTGILKSSSDEGIPLWIDETEISNLPQNHGDKKMYEWLKDSRNFKGIIKHRGNILDESGTSVRYL